MDEQLCILQKMSNAQKAALWQYKGQKLLEDKTLSKEEKSEIKILFETLTPESYSEEGQATFNAFAESWKKEAQKKFGWSNEQVFEMFETWLTKEEIEIYKARRKL